MENSKLKSVKVIFKNPVYNYVTSVNGKSSEEGLRNYFVNTVFDVGGYPVEDLQKCIDIKFL
jgi:hypothetical protein